MCRVRNCNAHLRWKQPLEENAVGTRRNYLWQVEKCPLVVNESQQNCFRIRKLQCLYGSTIKLNDNELSFTRNDLAVVSIYNQ